MARIAAAGVMAGDVTSIMSTERRSVELMEIGSGFAPTTKKSRQGREHFLD